MSSSQPTRIQQLLPDVLMRVARDTGGARALAPIWDDAVGPAIARQARPMALEDRRLVLAVSNAAWATELQTRSGELLQRLHTRIDSGRVATLAFRVC